MEFQAHSTDAFQCTLWEDECGAAVLSFAFEVGGRVSQWSLHRSIGFFHCLLYSLLFFTWRLSPVSGRRWDGNGRACFNYYTDITYSKLQICLNILSNVKSVSPFSNQLSQPLFYCRSYSATWGFIYLVLFYFLFCFVFLLGQSLTL